MEEWKEHAEQLEQSREEGAKPIPLKPDIVFRNKVIRRLYMSESEEVKAEVEEYRNNPEAAREDEADPDLDSAETERVSKAQAIQK